MKFPAALLTLALVSCVPGGGSIGGSPSLPARGESPQIFTSYNAKGLSKRQRGWVSKIDTTGIALDDTRTCSLITPRHVVMARHYQRPPGSPVVFHDASGTAVKRMLLRVLPCQGDVAVGLLDEAVPSRIRTYPLPDVGSSTAALVGMPVLVTDQKRCIFIHQVAGVFGGSITFRYDEQSRHGWNKKLVVGDSGNPSFVIANGRLVLIETHTSGGPGSGPYYGDAAVQASVRDAVARLDPSHAIRTIVIPP